MQGRQFMSLTLVNAHSERDGGAYNTFIGLHELHLDPLALIRRQTSVVYHRLQPMRTQVIGNLLCLLLQRDVDDGGARARLQHGQKVCNLVVHVFRDRDTQSKTVVVWQDQ